jgi:hypothetical protein
MNWLKKEVTMEIANDRRNYQTLIAVASLVGGPLLMTIGDLFHPAESMDNAEQIAILVYDASRWYAAHLLLFIGILMSIPGLFALSSLVEERRPAAGYAARILLLIGVAAFAAVFVGEMLLGRYVLDGADRDAAVDFLNSMLSGPMMAAVGPAMLAFFIGVAAVAGTLVFAGGTLRWIAALYSIGAVLILIEIVSAQVLLSQIGNALIFCAGAATARLILQNRARPQVGKKSVPASRSVSHA